MLINFKLFLGLFCVSLINFSISTELVESNNELALYLLHVLATDHNTFFSPLIISSSMVSLLNGANGKTKEELRHLLNIDSKCNVHIIQYFLSLREKKVFKFLV
jgi:serine protease inhibitor